MGDLVEGYVADPAEVDRQWAEIDGMLGELTTPLFHVPGNHDVSNPMMFDKWIERYGRTYYHFFYDDTLFLLLDTQDPPDSPGRDLAGTLERFMDQLRLDPAWLMQQIQQATDWNGTQPARLGDDQMAYFEAVLAEHSEARWTFLCMHMPLWQGDHPTWARLRAALGDRPFSAFAGHVHNYRATHDGPSTLVRLGPTGGLWVLGGPEGNFHHVTQVTMTKKGPVVANVLLDGLRNVEGLPIRPVTMGLVPLM